MEQLIIKIWIPCILALTMVLMIQGITFLQVAVTSATCNRMVLARLKYAHLHFDGKLDIFFQILNVNEINESTRLLKSKQISPSLLTCYLGSNHFIVKLQLNT